MKWFAMCFSIKTNNPVAGGMASGRGRARGRRCRAGFTLLEILLAVAILAAVMAVTYMVFNTVLLAWRRGVKLTEDMHHGDFVMEQLVIGLRSAYYPDTREKVTAYGLWLGNDGAGETARDTLSWVKLGSALVGQDCPYIGAPHRVFFSIESGDGLETGGGAAVRSWRVQGRIDADESTWDPMAQDPVVLSRRVTGFNCRVGYRKTAAGDEIDWLDDWDHTNKLPMVAELTLYLDPLDEGRDPIVLRRVLNIPVAPLSAPW